jgi:hypothetical protein
VVGSFLVVAFFELLDDGAVFLHGVLEKVSDLLVGFNNFRVLFGVVLLRRYIAKG